MTLNLIRVFVKAPKDMEEGGEFSICHIYRRIRNMGKEVVKMRGIQGSICIVHPLSGVRTLGKNWRSHVHVVIEILTI